MAIPANIPADPDKSCTEQDSPEKKERKWGENTASALEEAKDYLVINLPKIQPAIDMVLESRRNGPLSPRLFDEIHASAWAAAEELEELLDTTIPELQDFVDEISQSPPAEQSLENLKGQLDWAVEIAEEYNWTVYLKMRMITHCAEVKAHRQALRDEHERAHAECQQLQQVSSTRVTEYIKLATETEKLKADYEEHPALHKQLQPSDALAEEASASELCKHAQIDLFRARTRLEACESTMRYLKRQSGELDKDPIGRAVASSVGAKVREMNIGSVVLGGEPERCTRVLKPRTHGATGRRLVSKLIKLMPGGPVNSSNAMQGDLYSTLRRPKLLTFADVAPKDFPSSEEDGKKLINFGSQPHAPIVQNQVPKGNWLTYHPEKCAEEKVV